MTQDRRVPGVLVVIVSLLVVTAVPVLAAGVDDTASIHTTATDFQSAAQLDNKLDISGSGSGAQVVLDETVSYNVVDDSGDGTIDQSKRPWVGDDGFGNAVKSEFQTRPDINGTIENLTIYKSKIDGSDYGFTVDIYAVQEAADTDTGEGTLIKSGFDPDFSSGTTTIILDTTFDVTAGENWTIEFVTQSTDSDSTVDSIDVNGDGDSGLTNWYWSNAAGLQQDIGMNITLEGRASDTDNATYVSATHAASNIEQGFTDLTLQNASAEVTWEYYTGTTWADHASATYTSSGNKTQSWSVPGNSNNKWRVNVTFNATSGVTDARLDDEGVQFEASPPTLDNNSASPDSTDLTTNQPSLEIDVTDADYATSQDDTVTVTYYTKAPTENSFSKEGTDTLNSNGTASLQSTFSEGGQWEWYVKAEDSYGETSPQSNTFTFTVPATVEIRNETPVHGKVNNADVELVFYEQDDDNPTIVNRTVSNGEVDLTGLPVGSQFAVTVETQNHHTRTVLIDDIFNQDSIYMLQTATTSVETTFSVEDSTGEFPAENTELLVQRAINDSVYDPNGDGFNWTTVAGDQISAAGTLTTDLEKDHRYRLIVRNDDGDHRILGAYSPISDGVVNLRIGSVSAVPQDPGLEYTYNATRVNNSGTININVEYNDTVQNTTTLWVEIYNRSDPSQRIYGNTSFSDLGTLAISQQVPAGQEDTTWVVKLTIDRAGNELQTVKIPFGPTQPLLQDMPGWLVAVISVGSLFIVGGLFSQVNGDVGAIVIAAMGGLFYFVEFLPSSTGIGVVVLAMIVAGLLFVQERRAGGI